jgi:citrate lyase subunit beta/citryl-CoA lyase
MRSLLVVAADMAAAIEQARGAGADVIILELAGAQVVDRREQVTQTIASLHEAGASVHVCLSHVEISRTREELAAAICPELDGIHYPEVEAPAQVRELDVLIREQEMRNEVRPGTAVLIPKIESARGILRCEDIARASTRIAGLAFGSQRYSESLGLSYETGLAVLDYARGIVATVCAAYGLVALDSSPDDALDGAASKTQAERLRLLGFKGRYTSAPAQVATLNAAFGGA